jgi:hypothetical protein
MERHNTGYADGSCPDYTHWFETDAVSHDNLQSSRTEQDASAQCVLSSKDAYSTARIVPPSDDELMRALLMGADIDYNNSGECFRVLLTQNSVILRDAISSRTQQRLQPLMSGSPLADSSCSSLTSMHSSSSHSETSESSKRMRISPPKNFSCPLCFALLNEKDFDRHVATWISKVDNHKLVKEGQCPGIQDVDHPLLAHFVGSCTERVGSLVKVIRSLVRPGAYDAMSAEGSGRHTIVAERFAQLMQPP